ncbi:unnamed protein product, partial [Polarella glacialis]
YPQSPAGLASRRAEEAKTGTPLRPVPATPMTIRIAAGAPAASEKAPRSPSPEVAFEEPKAKSKDSASKFQPKRRGTSVEEPNPSVFQPASPEKDVLRMSYAEWLDTKKDNLVEAAASTNSSTAAGGE